ncbi:MAG: DoxX family protein [Cyanobacteria bacterium J06623_7]
MLETILELGRNLYSSFPVGKIGFTLLALRVTVGLLFVLHGYPKINHLQTWSNALKMPIYLCFLSAYSMFFGGFCLMAGFLTPFACLSIACSMTFALYLEIKQGLPFVAPDPYLIPQGDYDGPNGKGEPPSQEKAFIFDVMLIALLVLGPGAYSIDALLFGSLY